jgi:hypothetical protein
MDSLNNHTLKSPYGTEPLLLPVHKTKEEGLTKGELYQACVTLLELIKLKNDTRLSGWGKN